MKSDRSLAGSVSLIPRKARPPAEGGSVDTHLSESDGHGEERESQREKKKSWVRSKISSASWNSPGENPLALLQGSSLRGGESLWRPLMAALILPALNVVSLPHSSESGPTMQRLKSYLSL